MSCCSLQLVCATLRNLLQSPSLQKSDLYKRCMCNSPCEKCRLKECPQKDGLTIQVLNLLDYEDEQVICAIWGKREPAQERSLP